MITIRKRSHGFTLIELLVVISIIATLASMLMPTFSRAREQARKIVCMSNLKQMGLAMAMYLSDNDSGYPIAWAFWCGAAGSGCGGTYPDLKVGLEPYVKNSQVWWCPSWSGVYGFNAWGNSNGSGFDFVVPSGGAAGTQPIIGDPVSGNTYSEAALTQPSDYPVLWCGSHWTQSLNAHSGVTDASFFGNGGVGGTNILYADSHAKFIRFSYGQWLKIYNTPR